jgi:hypothetical protein
MRATVMSIRSFIIRTLFAVIAPTIGYVADIYSLSQALLLSGILFFTIGGLTLFFLLQVQQKK